MCTVCLTCHSLDRFLPQISVPVCTHWVSQDQCSAVKKEWWDYHWRRWSQPPQWSWSDSLPWCNPRMSTAWLPTIWKTRVIYTMYIYTNWQRNATTKCKERATRSTGNEEEKLHYPTSTLSKWIVPEFTYFFFFAFLEGLIRGHSNCEHCMCVWEEDTGPGWAYM